MDTWNIKIIKSRRKSIALQINEDMSLTVRAPYFMKNEDIMEFVGKKSAWIEGHIRRLQQERDKSGAEKGPADRTDDHATDTLSMEEIRKLADKAMEYIPRRVQYFAKILDVSYNRITIRNQRTRWGSCSGKGNLNFNCLLMLMPEDIIDYVVVHELCHRKEMNHSKAFWNEVSKIIPDYKDKVRWLEENGANIMRRMGF